jgi:methyl-accepting chemotaxis protein
MRLVARSLKWKVVGGFGLVAAVAMLASGIALRSNSILSTHVISLEDVANDKVLASSVSSALSSAMLNTREYLMTFDQKAVQAARASIEEIKQKVSDELASLSDSDQRQRATQINDAAQQFATGLGTLVTHQEKRNEVFNGAMSDSGNAMRVAITQINVALTERNEAGLANRVAQLNESVLLSRLYVLRFMLTNAEADFKRALDELEQVRARYDGLKPVLAPFEAIITEQTAAFEAGLKTYGASITELHDAIVKRNEVRSVVLDKLGDEIAGHAGDMVAAANKTFETTVATAHQDAAVQAWIVKLATFGGVALAIGLGLFLASSLTKPIRALTGQMTSLAEGRTDIDVIGRERSDEIGAMAGAVEVFRVNALERQRLEAEAEAASKAKAETARRFEEAIEAFQLQSSEVLSQLDANSRQMEETANSLGALAGNARTEADAAANASIETSTNIQTVAAAAEELTGSIHEISRQVTNATGVVRGAAETTLKSADDMEGLAAAAQRIGDVVGLIQGIAAQTNLLALNATIEAARAGEAGRGFAVVAQEVKALATQTARATDEIGGQIAAIQGSTRSAVEAMREITRKMDEIDRVTASIAAAIEEQGAATSEISASVQIAARGTESLAANVNSVSGSIGETSRSSDSVRSASLELTSGTARLAEEIHAFFLALRGGPLNRRVADDPSYRGPERRKTAKRAA